ncbi:multicopper oxidase [Xylariaceae sp. FL1019]|nr:multicopper oxidase [Xylariaceae sp. FL1019]
MIRGYIFALAYASVALASTVTYNWETTWVWADPDDTYRPVIGINGTWPCPKIEANVNDTVVINLSNGLGNETTGIHFHGINQVNTNYMDGAVGTNQCPLPPGKNVTYSFLADAAGSFWYHSHDVGQYPDGFRGPLIVHDPNDPYLDQYDDDVIITVTDWYHGQSPTLVQNMLQTNNTNDDPPRPSAILVNEGSDGRISVKAGKTYRFRIMNFSALTGAFFVIKSLAMGVIMADASYTQKLSTNHLRVSPGQRFDVLVTIGNSDTQNYPFLFALDTNTDYTNTSADVAYHYNFTGQLVTDSGGDLNGTEVVDTWYPLDDMTLLPYSNQTAYGPVTSQWVLDFDYCTDANGYPRACFNGTTFISQKVPSLYSAVSLGSNNTEVTAYGQVNAFTVAYGEVLEIVINNHDGAIHPFHLHGHQFQVVERPASNGGNWTGDTTVPDTPLQRDTLTIFAQSYAVLRIVANNPGVFLLHCHIEWHVAMGLTATLIEAPEKLTDYTIPQDMIDICEDQGIPVTGNAAGNDLWSNTTGFVTINPTTFVGALWVASTTSSGASSSATA